MKITYNTGKAINIAVQNVLKFLITSSIVEINIFMINIDVSLYVQILCEYFKDVIPVTTNDVYPHFQNIK